MLVVGEDDGPAAALNELAHLLHQEERCEAFEFCDSISGSDVLGCLWVIHQVVDGVGGGVLSARGEAGAVWLIPQALVLLESTADKRDRANKGCSLVNGERRRRGWIP